VLLHPLRNGHQIAKTGRLAAGQQTERLVMHVGLPKGATTSNSRLKDSSADATFADPGAGR
jgi:hypothetical protein